MKSKQLKRNLVLGVLFLLPVAFLLLLFPTKHNYIPLDIVKEHVLDLKVNSSDSKNDIELKDHITVLGFFGNNPMTKATSGLNLKELIYDKFKGFKKFQIVILVSQDAKDEAEKLYREISSYEDLRFWHFVELNENLIKNTFNSLKADFELNEDLSTDNVFIIDTELNQRGRIDDRTDNEKEKNATIYGMSYYDCIEVAELKNKMGADDLRVLFTEYREKRKGIFDSTIQKE
jgi:hypothetical protein